MATNEPRPKRPWILRLLTFSYFPDHDDTCHGPRWALALFLIAAFTGMAALLTCLWAMILSDFAMLHQAWAIQVGAFAVMSGASWHLGMRARAKNGVLLTLFWASLLLLL